MENINLSINQRKALSLFDSQVHIRTNDLLKKLKIPRPTVKQILMRLKELGLIEQNGLGRAAYYTIKQESEILDPQGKQLVTVYRGMDSFQSMFDRLARQLKSNDFYWSFAFKNEYHNTAVRDLLVRFHKELTANQVDDRSIASKEVEDIVRLNFSTVPDLDLRFTDVDIPVGLIILKDSVINLVWGEQPLAIVIKAPEIVNRYHNFFLTTWDQADNYKAINVLTRPGNSRMVPLHGSFGLKTLWMKDETQNPTHTFKDRLAYEMVRPLYEQWRAGKQPTPTTFASISYGNTAKAMGYYTSLVNKIIGKDVAHAIAFVPPSLEKKQFGPDTYGTKVAATIMLDGIKQDCQIIPIDLKKQVWESKDLEILARQHNAVQGEFIDITEGLNRPAYASIIIESIEQQLKQSPDYVIVPFGAGILCNEIIDFIYDYHLHTKVIPVSSGDPDTIAVMLYGPIWVDTNSLIKNGWGFTRHENLDRKGRKREPYKVYHVNDDELRNAMAVLHSKDLHAEPSGASGFAILPRLQEIDPNFDPKKHSVLVINTGDGLLNY